MAGINSKRTTDADIHLQGEMIIAQAERLIGYMNKICSVHSKTVRLDLSEVSRIDTCGVAVLMICHNRIQAAGGMLTLDSVSEDVLPMFTVCNVNDLFFPGDNRNEKERGHS